MFYLERKQRRRVRSRFLLEWKVVWNGMRRNTIGELQNKEKIIKISHFQAIDAASVKVQCGKEAERT